MTAMHQALDAAIRIQQAHTTHLKHPDYDKDALLLADTIAYSITALMQAHPLLVLLGDYIGNKHWRCDAVLAVWRALEKLGETP